MRNRCFGIVLLLIALVCNVTVFAGGFRGTGLPDEGGSFYLYNLYQSKFLSSLQDLKGTLGVTPKLFTITASDGGYTLSGSNVVWTFAPVEEGYNITSSAGALMFSAGTACAVGNLSEGFNADKSIWRLVSESEYSAYQAKNRFTVAALNVDGMPEKFAVVTLNKGAMEEAGATAIGQKLVSMGYDVVGVSEDFNYDNYIFSQIKSSYAEGTWRGGIEYKLGLVSSFIFQKSPLIDTDGLNLFWKTASAKASKENWTAWSTHYGYTDSGADGLIDKGYRSYLITLADGTTFDLYILHMDAEVSEGDLEARNSQLTQLATAIKATNNKRPIIVMGDTNCRYTRDKVKALFIDVINKDSRFSVWDPWIKFGRGGEYPTYVENNAGEALMASELGYRMGEVVDKVFYINNTDSPIRLMPESYAQDLSFVDDSGVALADHWPCVVEFSYYTYMPGDVNLDGKVSIADVASLIDILMAGDGDVDSPADVNGDKQIDASDVTALVELILQE